MAWHDTWTAMRGREKGRGWMTRSDMLASLRKEGYSPTVGQVAYVLRKGLVDRPVMAYGHFRFSEHHLNQMRCYLDRLREKEAVRVTG